MLAASLVVGTATTVGYSLATGFDRAADRADLPDIIARFGGEDLDDIDPQVSSLPNLEARSFRSEELNHGLRFGPHRTRKGAVITMLGGRRGYASSRAATSATARRAMSSSSAGWRASGASASATRSTSSGTSALRVVGIAISPDNVAYPLASAARIYITAEQVRGRPRHNTPNVALLWLNDPSKADVTLTQARSVTFGVGRLQFITRSGVEILLSQAAGIVISLLIAFSLVALVAAGTMLAAGAHADVQRRLTGLGVQRALGFRPGRIAAQQATEATLVAVPAAAAGIALGALIVARPAAELLAALNELGPGAALAGPLAIALTGVVAVVVAAATWPAWRAARRPPVEILRGGDLARTPARAAVAACSRSASASPPRRGHAGWRRWRRSPSAPASSR